MTRGRPRPVDAGAVAVHLPEGLRGEPVRLRLGGLGRAVRHLLRRHDRAVPVQQAEERLMTGLSSPSPVLRTPSPSRTAPRPGRRLAGAAYCRRHRLRRAHRRRRRAAGAVLLDGHVARSKHRNEVFTVPIEWIPDTVVWQQLRRHLAQVRYDTWLRNTLFLVGRRHLPAGAHRHFAAYGFAKMRFPGGTRCSWSTSARSRCRGSRT